LAVKFDSLAAGGALHAASSSLRDHGFEWSIIDPLLPNKPRGVPRADDRKVLNGIYWHLRSGSPWDEIPDRYGPYTTCYNRFVNGGAKLHQPGGLKVHHLR
jgi:hypothetical protein